MQFLSMVTLISLYWNSFSEFRIVSNTPTRAECRRNPTRATAAAWWFLNDLGSYRTPLCARRLGGESGRYRRPGFGCSS